MGYGRKGRGYDGGKGSSRPKLALVGAIVLAIGILTVIYAGNEDVNFMMGGFFASIAGTIMLLLSLSKRNQIRLSKGIDKGIAKTAKTFKDDCQCCKCSNCDRDHNHWTHD